MMFTMTPPNERNFETLIDMINASECREDEEDPANEDSSDETIADAFEGAGIKVKSGSFLTLTGTGTLTVDGSSCKNGIKGAASSTVTVGESASDSFTLNVSAANNALAADGELVINGGTVNVTSADDGIKASPDDDDSESKGEITINGGTITVNAADDAIHGENVNILGGGLTITAGDDAVKAEYTLTFGSEDGSGPDINVVKAYEGFEGATIELRGGKGSIYSTDDDMGYPLIPMLSGIAEMVLRIFAIIFLLPHIGFRATAYAEIIAWIGALALNIGAYMIYYRKANQSQA